MNHRSTMAVAVISLALASHVLAQKSQEQLARLRDEKMAQAVFQQADWTFDYDKARALAKSSDKLIFAYFTRSYAG